MIKMKKSFFWIVLLMIGVLFFWGTKSFGKKKEAPAYKPEQVVRGDLRVSVLTTGVVQPYNRLEIKPPVGGRMDQILVEEGQSVKKGQILAWLSSTERAALLDAARAKGQAEVAHWEELYKPTPIIAPLDGFLIAKNSETGQTVTVQDAVLVMSDRLIVKAIVDETDIGQIQKDQKAHVTLDAFPDTVMDARVDHIAYEAKTVNNVTTYEVDLIPDGASDFMRSGMTANVTFFVAERKDVLILPAEGVHQSDGRTMVMVPDPHRKKIAIPKEVKIGLTDGKRIEIVSGLNESETVLVPIIKVPRSSGSGQTNPFSPWGNKSGGRRNP